MSEIIRLEAEKKLTAKQQLTILHLTQGTSVVETAKKVGVDERTIRRWKHLPEFQIELRQVENDLFDENLSLLKRSMRSAIVTLIRNMGEKVSPYVQVQAASKVVDANMDLQTMTVIEDKIKLFESLLKEAGLK